MKPSQKRFFIMTYAVSVSLLRNCKGQDMPVFKTPTHALNVTHRSDFCGAYDLVDKGAVAREDTLRGLNLSVGVFDYHLDPTTGGIDDNQIAMQFLDELARRAGFQWRNSWGVLEAPSGSNNFTFDSILFWATDVYDIMSEYYARNVQRLKKGAIFVESWYDASLIMIMKQEQVDEFNLFTFAEPFTWQVWVLSFVTVIVSGVVYYLTDYLESRRRSEKMEASLSTNVFHGLYAFTGHSMFVPRSISTRLVALSLCFTFLVLSSAYTANMASNFIIDYKPAVTVNVIKDAIVANLVFCVWDSAASHNFLTNYYQTAKVLPLDSEDECAEALINGDCDVYLAFAGTWERLKRNGYYNGDCRLEWVGRTVMRYESGFSLKDNRALCSSLLSEVLSYHMVEMKAEGRFDEIWDAYYEVSETVDCEAQDATTQGKSSLTVGKSGSLFIFHFCAMIIAILISYVRFLRMPAAQKSRMTMELRNAARNPEKLMLAASFANKKQPSKSRGKKNLMGSLNLFTNGKSRKDFGMYLSDESDEDNDRFADKKTGKSRNDFGKYNSDESDKDNDLFTGNKINNYPSEERKRRVITFAEPEQKYDVVDSDNELECGKTSKEGKSNGKIDDHLNALQEVFDILNEMKKNE